MVLLWALDNQWSLSRDTIDHKFTQLLRGFFPGWRQRRSFAQLVVEVRWQARHRLPQRPAAARRHPVGRVERSLTAGTASDVRVVVVDVVIEGSPIVVVVVDDVVKLRQLQSGAEDVEAENRLRCGPADLRSRNLQGETG